MSGWRVPGGPAPTVRCSVDGAELDACPGESLGATMIANGLDVVSRSIYRDRPRGVMTAGPEEPNALVAVAYPDRSHSLVAATGVSVVDGLRAQTISGRAPLEAPMPPARSETVNEHCEVLVIGSGPAGLAAADAAAATGARVVLAGSGGAAGGRLRGTARPQGLAWMEAVAARLAAAPNVRVLLSTTAVGRYDDGLTMLVECPRAGSGGCVTERLWRVFAASTVLATGATERPLVFARNDLPGVLLAGAAAVYLRRYRVAVGRRVVVATTNDSAYGTALELAAAGVEVGAVVDSRRAPSRPALVRSLAAASIPHLPCHVVTAAHGDPVLQSVGVARRCEDGSPDPASVRSLACDALAISAGWDPELGLLPPDRAALRWDPSSASFLAADASAAGLCAGAASGIGSPSAAIEQGERAGREAARRAGAVIDGVDPPPSGQTEQVDRLWTIALPGAEEPEEMFVDFNRDVTLADVRGAVRAGMSSPEHVKRRTTLATGIDQGRMIRTLALGVIAQETGGDVSEMRPTTWRAPAIPVSFATLAGPDRGEYYDPVRRTPMHELHIARGAVLEDVGQWKRPLCYPGLHERVEDAVARECLAVRRAAGIVDVSTLGKLDVCGPDAPEFLDRMYTNTMSRIPVGGCRYGVMCGLDGMVFDDGVVMRLAEDRYLATTTTGHAGAVLEWFDEWLQTEWPDLALTVTPLTEELGALAVAGPRARVVLAGLAPDLDLDAEAFPFMTHRRAEVAGLDVRIGRVSFSGELAYELYVGAGSAAALWQAVLERGEREGLQPYGTEALHVLRAEKGFIVVGQDTDGTVTPFDLGLEWAIGKGKEDFIGKRSLRRPDALREDRRQFVGLLPSDPQELLADGAQLLEAAGDRAGPGIGHVTSTYRSPALGRTIALGLLRGGARRHGETVHATSASGPVPVHVTGPAIYDPQGLRRDG